VSLTPGPGGEEDKYYLKYGLMGCKDVDIITRSYSVLLSAYFSLPLSLSVQNIRPNSKDPNQSPG
jgi:hypothetical protein